MKNAKCSLGIKSLLMIFLFTAMSTAVFAQETYTITSDNDLAIYTETIDDDEGLVADDFEVSIDGGKGVVADDFEVSPNK